MLSRFCLTPLSEINQNDMFFDSLKADYPGFEQWFYRKVKNNENAFTYIDKIGIAAFLLLKNDETEEIILQEGRLPLKSRMKICTFKVDERIQGVRLGEGAIGLALWTWQKRNISDEIYLTVFEKQKELINLIQHFGFSLRGHLKNGECLFSKIKSKLAYTTPYACFPYISGNTNKAGLLPIESGYHDTLFPYSELYGTKQEYETIAASNGISKVFIGTPWNMPNYKKNELLFIYRISEKMPKKFHSVVTSVCTISKIHKVKEDYRYSMSKEEYLQIIGNKSVFTEKQLSELYFSSKKKNIIVLELVYNLAFGSGNNITMNAMKEAGYWSDCHPYNFEYDMNAIANIFSMAKQNIQEFIIQL